jgi:trk system potassium uptake protein TrkA
MTIINNPAYVDLVQGGDIDIAISPQLAIGTLLAHVRRAISSACTRCAAVRPRPSSEAHAGGRARWSAAIENIALPPGTTIGAIIRDEEVMIAHDDTVIEWRPCDPVRCG